MAVSTYVYDIECYPNLFMITFIPLNINKVLFDTYIAADKKGNAEHKEMLLKAMGRKSFYIFKGYGKDRTVKDDRRLIHDFMSVHKILYGYNSYGYDSLMLDLFLYNSKHFNNNGFDKDQKHITTQMHEFSSSIIGYGKGFKYTLDIYKYYKRSYIDRDIQKILYLDKTYTGLKKVAINLKWYRIQELPLSPSTYLTHDQVEEILDYNVNDVLITMALIWSQKEELDIREVGSKEFDIDLTNMSRSSIGKSLVSKYYSLITELPYKMFKDERTQRYQIPIAPLIDHRIEFKTPAFNKLFSDVKRSTIYISSDKDKSQWGFTLNYNGTKYMMAKGGLHSKDSPGIYDVTRELDIIMRDADVASFYPKIVVNLRICPEHLIPSAFLSIVHFVMNSRIKAKHDYTLLAKTDPVGAAMLKKKAEIYKIAINRMYGAFKDAYDYLYDPKCTYKTTVNGQLYLLVLVERLEMAGIHVISANTDGIVCKFSKILEPIYNEICSQWQKDFDFELEFTDYEKYVRNDVNNYIAIKKGFYAEIADAAENKARAAIEKKYIKRKGMFVDKPEFSAGWINPIVSTALANKYIYDTDIIKTLKDNMVKPGDIYNFCITQKIDKKFDAQYHSIVDGKLHVEKLQQYNRFYISKLSKGNLLKYDPTTKRLTSIVAKQNLAILNTYRDEVPTDVNFSYYGNECLKIINGNKKKDGISTLTFDLEFENDNPDIIDIYEDYSYLYSMEDEW